MCFGASEWANCWSPNLSLFSACQACRCLPAFLVLPNQPVRILIKMVDSGREDWRALSLMLFDFWFYSGKTFSLFLPRSANMSLPRAIYTTLIFVSIYEFHQYSSWRNLPRSFHFSNARNNIRYYNFFKMARDLDPAEARDRLMRDLNLWPF